MYRFAAAGAALLASTAIAQADIERTNQSLRILYEDTGELGSYVELSYGSIMPEAGANGYSNPLTDYDLTSIGYLYRFNDQFSVAMIYDQPFGAGVDYTPGVPFFDGQAVVESDAITVVGRYEINDRFSVHAGVRALGVEGDIYTNVAGPVFHLLEGESDWGYGYVVGAAYEIPDIALRVALTYNSAIEVSFDADETPFNPATGTPVGPTAQANFDVEFPESINLEFQSGIAENTLIFGSIRHAFWDGFRLSTTVGDYVNFTSDSTTYTLGVGRQFNENWAGSVSYLHRTDGTIPSDTALAPTTGLDSVTLGLRYTRDAFTISGSLTLGVPGDQVVQNGIVGDIDFDDNFVSAVGVRVGFRF
ncbi:outer membrane protein transport protein [Roseibacterium beibuensis]|uniref:Outer membrane protein transport protein n=1 Tax=[Roseibacterium] beibuensis TaxID=1193142 RepID=A0ABP9L4Q2_9RHOB|nr:outer membrane protein transport protein [Roseibacterium beibuensis]MCS6621369.1 outer membrane protein transport protein [Roseibacterium beibuensis]